ncbi:putative amidohydrolase [Motilibacter rhizosphaerae]|uniref:Putative amidohydrolase n=1 Tax=Motilibacter rhizosphaerae TaxID=598652 RepID=A0A4Q7NVL2_9ACTN|nr:carbon-nitrogen family hydrolase [Motilibacter rhizosphaerae]RZS91010.1 putative amidohydrolase [Motilibacter rhizosphaerae]
MRAALLQLDGDLSGTVADRVAHAVGLVEQAAPDADLVVLPELWAHGAWDIRDWQAVAEPLDGPTVRALREVAARTSTVVHAGSVLERAADGELYNTSVLIGSDGAVLRHYRKIHRFGFDEGEAAVLAPGTELVTAEHGDAVLGLATCYDLRFPEMFRLLLDSGVTVLVLVASWPATRVEHWRTLLRARAIENQMWVLGCNQSGTQGRVELGGASAVVDPAGVVVAEAGSAEQVLTAMLDPAQVPLLRKAFPVLRDRRL